MSLMIFEWREDEELGGEGWIAKGYPNFNITSVGGFGHDCMEHFPRGLQRGPAADELLALGARWWMRVSSGWWHRQGYLYAPENTFGHELQNIFRNLGRECLDGIAPRKTPSSFYVDDILSEAVEAINNGEDDYGNFEQMTEESDFIVNAGKWLQVGFAAAQERYKGYGPYDVLLLSEQLDRMAKRYQHGEYGHELHVRVHEKNMDVSMRIVELSQ